MIVPKPPKLITPKPAAAIAAPAMEPINAWEELLGIPKYQVTKFQIIAAIRAANMIVDPLSRAKGSTISFVIVFATPVNVIAPKKFMIAARAIATRGRIAFVDTLVAIALAVSWKPLIKSNTTANMTINTVINNTLSIMSKNLSYAFFIMTASSVLATASQ